jgi:hypothetical protein
LKQNCLSSALPLQSLVAAMRDHDLAAKKGKKVKKKITRSVDIYPCLFH